jgi:hypothetical protein
MLTPIDYTLAAQSATPVGRLLGGLDTLVAKLRQTNVPRHDLTPSCNSRVSFSPNGGGERTVPGTERQMRRKILDRLSLTTL